jgi:hypothetical protein
MTITFLTASDRVDVDEGHVAELLRRLDRSSTIPAAILEREERGVRLTGDQKAELLSALEAWGFEPHGIAAMGALADLRYELMRDLRIPPFDD